jgi:hypothetical protein
VESDFDPGGAALAGEPRGDDPGVVVDQHVARPQQRRQVADRAVVQRIALDLQQPRRIARHGGPPGDPLARQLEIEVAELHGPGAGHAPSRAFSHREKVARRAG